MADYLFTSESVTEGHPDKVCDQISDGILDACLTDDPHSRVACEALTKTGMVILAGEITTKTYVEMPSVVREVLKDIGYSGYLSLEVMDLEPDPETIAREGLAAMRGFFE